MYKIAAVGDRDSVYGFAALGLDTYFETDAQSAAALLRRLEREDYAVIYITEKLASELEGELERFEEKSLPAVIPIPGVTGNTGLGAQKVRQAVIKAVGSDIV